jgi:hypothetical protein
VAAKGIRNASTKVVIIMWMWFVRDNRKESENGSQVSGDLWTNQGRAKVGVGREAM